MPPPHEEVSSEHSRMAPREQPAELSPGWLLQCAGAPCPPPQTDEGRPSAGTHSYLHMFPTSHRLVCLQKLRICRSSHSFKCRIYPPPSSFPFRSRRAGNLNAFVGPSTDLLYTHTSQRPTSRCSQHTLNTVAIKGIKCEEQHTLLCHDSSRLESIWRRGWIVSWIVLQAQCKKPIVAFECRTILW